MRHVFTRLLLLGLCFAVQAQADAIFKRPQYFGAAISPGGNYLAVAARGANGPYTVTVKDDNRTVIASDASGKVIWFTDLSAVKGVVGAPVVRQLTLQDGKVTATYGKHASVLIDLKTGKVISISSD